MSAGQKTTFRMIRTLLLVSVAGATIVLSGCGGASEAEVNQATKVALEAQAQKDTIKDQLDTQATLSADVKRLKDEAATAAATQAAAAKAAAAKTAAAKVTAARAKGMRCTDELSVGPNTSCLFARAVASEFFGTGGESVIYVHSPVTQTVYKMTCTRGMPTVCRGGNNAVVYIR